MKQWDAVVVGSGPNGLTAAVLLAKAGHSVLVVEGQSTLGGGARTLPLTLPGFQHDVCSAIHPMAVGSPVFQALELDKLGVEYVHSPVAVAHPLDGGRAAVLERGVDATAERLGPDARVWRRLMAPLVRDYDALKALLYSPVSRPPLRSPLLAARFGLHALESAVDFAEGHFETEEAKALLAGCAAHSFCPLTAPLTNAFGLALAVQAQAVGWPLVRGGSQRIVDALVALLLRNGGEVVRDFPVEQLSRLPESKLVLLDTHAHVAERLCGDALPDWYRSLLRDFEPGPGVFKIDYALSGPMPWTAPEAHRAATLHLGGTMRELTESEAQLARGECPSRPYVLVAQQSRFDDSRAPAGQHTLWAYCHVPNGSDADLTEALEAQLERFAPGFRRLVLARSVRRTSHFEAGNAAYVGGDISGGSVAGAQLFFRPTPWLHRTPNPRILLCGASTPPGPAVHGMCGYWAAQVALERLRG